jgi:hypothetical protein
MPFFLRILPPIAVIEIGLNNGKSVNEVSI